LPVVSSGGGGGTGKETEPWEIVYFKLYQSQIPVIDKAVETPMEVKLSAVPLVPRNYGAGI
jgi:hypothetical protein